MALSRGSMGGRRRVLLGPKIKRPGELNEIALRRYGVTYFALGQDRRREVLRTLKNRGLKQNQVLGKLQIQQVFRKRMPDHVKAKIAQDRAFVVNLYA